MTFTDTTSFVGRQAADRPTRLIADDPVSSVAGSPGGRFMAAGHEGGTIRLWPMPDGSRPTLHDIPHDDLLAMLKTRVDVTPNRLGNMGGGVGAPLRKRLVPGRERFPAW